MTQLEFEDKMRKLREEQKQKTLALHQMQTMKVQERLVVKQQLDSCFARNKELGAEITAISNQIHAINVEYTEKKTRLNDEYWGGYVPKEYKPLDVKKATSIRNNVLNALKKALDGKCNTDEIAFDFHFSEDGEVTFKTKIPEIWQQETELK